MKIAQWHEEIFNGCRQSLEFFIIGEMIQYNLQDHEQRVEMIYSFGGNR